MAGEAVTFGMKKNTTAGRGAEHVLYVFPLHEYPKGWLAGEDARSVGRAAQEILRHR